MGYATTSDPSWRYCIIACRYLKGGGFQKFEKVLVTREELFRDWAPFYVVRVSHLSSISEHIDCFSYARLRLSRLIVIFDLEEPDSKYGDSFAFGVTSWSRVPKSVADLQHDTSSLCILFCVSNELKQIHK